MGQGDIQECRSLEILEALLEVCQPSNDLSLNEDRWLDEHIVSARLKLEKAASRPLSLKQQCRNSIRNVLSLRSKGSSVWPYIERLELQSGLPECLVDYLLVFPDRGWREERARKVAVSLNNIAVSGPSCFNDVSYIDISRVCSVSHQTPTRQLLSRSKYPRGSSW